MPPPRCPLTARPDPLVPASSRPRFGRATSAGHAVRDTQDTQFGTRRQATAPPPAVGAPFPHPRSRAPPLGARRINPSSSGHGASSGDGPQPRFRRRRRRGEPGGPLRPAHLSTKPPAGGSHARSPPWPASSRGSPTAETPPANRGIDIATDSAGRPVLPPGWASGREGQSEATHPDETRSAETRERASVAMVMASSASFHVGLSTRSIGFDRPAT